MTNRTDGSLIDAIIRLQKLDLDQHLRATVEEAWNLLGDGHQIEAEALIENVDARVRQSLNLGQVGASPMQSVS